MTISYEVVTPVETGVHKICDDLKALDPGFRRGDEPRVFFRGHQFLPHKKNSLFIN
jgi:hypothetical protein